MEIFVHPVKWIWLTGGQAHRSMKVALQFIQGSRIRKMVPETEEDEVVDDRIFAVAGCRVEPGSGLGASGVDE
ncbi:MAG: hypothetical protein WBX18_02845, partial [Terracidiphilus sp.]